MSKRQGHTGPMGDNATRAASIADSEAESTVAPPCPVAECYLAGVARNQQPVPINERETTSKQRS